MKKYIGLALYSSMMAVAIYFLVRGGRILFLPHGNYSFRLDAGTLYLFLGIYILLDVAKGLISWVATFSRKSNNDQA